ncbi:leucine-rich repeat and death domain-containing protein 1 [Hydra vulgaris]|uniref:leucine-rich repeat and death domain-containing protein 1 n=1 Tax=Hydra vulgaris TaxID=6087 RepID=UPI001F5FA8CE|nr:leucine-rich repeat and death domain-containing protein 1 [Hydra vulgaris]
MNQSSKLCVKKMCKSKPCVKKNNSANYVINLSSNNLKCIPSELFSQKSCKSINLSCNFIKLIPENVFPGNNVVELVLFSNELTDIRGLKSLPNIQVLKLQHNKIVCLNDSLQNAKSLKVLRLDSNLIHEIKQNEVSSLSNLTYLDVSSNLLKDISALNALVLLEELNCSHNNLTRLPVLSSLVKLLEINASFNCLNDVSGLSMLCQLLTLVLDNNKLNSLVSLKSLSSLQVLKISCNRFVSIKHIVEQFKELEVLHVDRNEIAEVSELKQLLTLSISLRELNIYDNPIMLNQEIQTEVYTFIKEMNLDILNRNSNSTSVIKQKIMRPMSTDQMISSRFVENQIINSNISINEYAMNLNKKFENLSILFSKLADKNELESSQHENETLMFKKKLSRPSSSCSSQSRILAAKVYADTHT